jgi:amino acid transporter
MAEEVKNASKVVPRAIQISVLLNGTLGLAMLVAYLFCLGNLDTVLEQSATLGYAYLYVFLQGTGSPAGAVTMAMIMWVLGVCCLVGLMAATSRQLWSFARDNAVPFSNSVTKVFITRHFDIEKMTDDTSSTPEPFSLTTLFSLPLELQSSYPLLTSAQLWRSPTLST